MKFFKPKKLPSKMMKILFDTYIWGYNTSQEKETPLDIETFKERINKGFSKGIKKRKD